MFPCHIHKANSQRIAYITASFGTYERHVKTPKKQTVDADFICFTNSRVIAHDGWIIDETPYHLTHPNPLDNGLLHNSLAANKHPFNVAKYYKQSFHMIPRLSGYEVVVWLDATLEIEYEGTSAWLLEKVVNQSQSVIGWIHSWRRGYLAEEAWAAWLYAADKYPVNDSSFLGIWQPSQQTLTQYHQYLLDGYQDKFINNSVINSNFYWDTVRTKVNNTSPHFGLWLTCFIAFDNKKRLVKEFLDLWYFQTLNYTTEDQVSFPYAAWKLNVTPYTLPDKEIWGDAPDKFTKFYWKHPHGKLRFVAR